ncbi:N-formylglutamate amidohydrolase [Sphingomonas sp. C3-2]|uniref:N-formylglutamate amidohydrolase n=1 Tax=Sphingomonas sp. C3-2 TaxID=3062169 RepID=UPI00294B6F6C|nr:N-formylglutamate amidohydrolase [Sphingomonas sp. C3-2]WOK36638.1 N-formylglutamate amidohydrolase [Sphingomonas sp. C3-2]
MLPLHLPGRAESGILIIVDHASNHVPEDIDLGVSDSILSDHMAVDIGTWDLCHDIAERLAAPAVLATVSRLVIDLNREKHAPGLIPTQSDGHAIPGNATLGEDARTGRIARFWDPYHGEVKKLIAQYRPEMLVSLHSFTPALKSDPDQARPWQIGVLYNEDDRAARQAIPMFSAAGAETGDNLPYSGKVLNATMNLHGEDGGIAYLGLEVRQDLISTPTGVAKWGEIIAPVIAETRLRLARQAGLPT